MWFLARYLLTSRQIVGSMPPVVFVKDKEGAAVKEVTAVCDLLCRPQEQQAAGLRDMES